LSWAVRVADMLEQIAVALPQRNSISPGGQGWYERRAATDSRVTCHLTVEHQGTGHSRRAAAMRPRPIV
jgi:hypothetical protein